MIGCFKLPLPHDLGGYKCPKMLLTLACQLEVDLN